MCSPATSRCNYPKCYQKHLLQILQELDILLRAHGISYWLAYGTLLGALRTGSFIPWDEDIDIGVRDTDIEKVAQLIPLLENLGRKVPHSIHSIDSSHNAWSRICNQCASIGCPVSKDRKKITLSCSPSLSSANSLHVDMFFFGQGNGKVYGWEDARFWYPEKAIDHLSTIEFCGQMFPCPTNPEDGIVSFYGEDWRTPKVKSWHGKRIASMPKVNAELLKEMEGYQWYDQYSRTYSDNS